MQHFINFITFDRTSITQRWRHDEAGWMKTRGFHCPLTAKQTGKVYVFSDESWPFYIGKTTRSLSNRLRDGFKATPENRLSGFGGYKFKDHMTEAFLHVFMGSEATLWSDGDAECIEAEVVFRIRQAGAWPRYQTEIHFSEPAPKHTTAANEIMAYFEELKKHDGLNRPSNA